MSKGTGKLKRAWLQDENGNIIELDIKTDYPVITPYENNEVKPNPVDVKKTNFTYNKNP